MKASPFHEGHVDVHQQDVRPVFFRRLQRHFAILCLSHHGQGHVQPAQLRAQAAAYLRLVIGDEYAPTCPFPSAALPFPPPPPRSGSRPGTRRRRRERRAADGKGTCGAYSSPMPEPKIRRGCGRDVEDAIAMVADAAAAIAQFLVEPGALFRRHAGAIVGHAQHERIPRAARR